MASNTTSVGAHRFRELFGYYMERAAAGEEILVLRHGKPRVRVVPAAPELLARQAAL